MAKLTCIFWRDIPAQVIGQQGRVRVKRELPPRFAQAIDRAAMRAGRGASDAYLADWRRVSEEAEGELERLVAERAAALETRFPDDVLESVVKAGGRITGAGGETQ
ncbi:MAG: virulence factor [Steroidobacteraceae bacterium]|nr:virulence factor [Steroidobacteraceae bacterium]